MPNVECPNCHQPVSSKDEHKQKPVSDGKTYACTERPDGSA